MQESVVEENIKMFSLQVSSLVHISQKHPVSFISTYLKFFHDVSPKEYVAFPT